MIKHNATAGIDLGFPGAVYQAATEYLEMRRGSSRTTREVFEALKERQLFRTETAQVKDLDAWGLTYTRDILKALASVGCVKKMRAGRNIVWHAVEPGRQERDYFNGN